MQTNTQHNIMQTSTINAETSPPHVNVRFPLQGRQLPADHGYALHSALTRHLPALHGASWVDLKIAQRLSAITGFGKFPHFPFANATYSAQRLSAARRYFLTISLSRIYVYIAIDMDNSFLTSINFAC